MIGASTDTGTGAYMAVAEAAPPRASLPRSRPLAPTTTPHLLTTRIVLAVFGLGAAAVIGLAVAHAPQPVILNLPLTAHIAGLLAGYAVTAMILMIARTPLLEHNIGADRMSRWHGILGRWTIALIVVHAVAATLGWAEARNLPITLATGQVLQMPGLPAAAVSTALFLIVGIASARSARRRLRYETWHAIHLLTYVAIALAFAHELAGPDLAGHPEIQIAWSIAYTLSFALLIRYRVLAPLLHAARHRLRVTAVVPEGEGVVSIFISGVALRDLDAQPGQFFRWRFVTPRTWLTAHPFSLSAPPADGSLRLTVKAVGDGTRALRFLRPGTFVVAEGPYGAMTERRRTRRGVLLIAGGVGITPMRALFESLSHRGGPLTLIYRAPTIEDILFRRELEAIARQRGAALIYWTGRSADPRSAVTPANLLAQVPDLAGRDVYLCAGPALTAATTSALRAAGLPRRHLHCEEFSF
ncbi:ferredoxin reductase family protein [Micromonospora sp. DT81.3]|uniref:ferredoxin reductase family protein n=1 Tax=Micromonospora sp. DT81.3 TaxID=3416523 RepID=UPI003CF99B1E